jgi:hypothetical protein
MGGRRAITFSDSRQGVARLAAKLQQDAERTLARAFLYHAEQEEQAHRAMKERNSKPNLRNIARPPSCSPRISPGACPNPECGAAEPRWNNTLRPAGFLGRRVPHTGYENLQHVPLEMAKLAARTRWQALPDPGVGRLRADSEGQVITQSSGPHGMGYALCLCCGRAEAEADDLLSPEMLRNHKPLAPLRREQLARNGVCPGGLTQRNRIQRNLRFVHEIRTDVFEWQLPSGQHVARRLPKDWGRTRAKSDWRHVAHWDRPDTRAFQRFSSTRRRAAQDS